MPLDTRPLRPRVPARDGRRAANDHTSAPREVAQHRIADASGRVVEIDVDAARTRLREVVLKRRRSIGERDVVAKPAETKLDLRRAAGDADGAAAHDLRDLPHGRA